MPRPGTFTLHDHALPDLPAGPYRLRGTQTVTAPEATPQRLDVHLEVTAPRFAMPRNEILSTFPPNQAEGAFSSRLPQIVLRRRTLPWERELDGRVAAGTLPRDLPWMALVLLADAEAELRLARPVAECVTQGVVLEGRNDVTVGDAVAVTRRVVQQVFPTQEELKLLAHVRQVDLSDTELAMGDDDGWLAVLFANRLPQPGVRYRACLVSLEGQHGELPIRAEVEPDPSRALEHVFVYPAAAARAGELSLRYGGTAGMGAAVHPVVGMATHGAMAQAPRAQTTADAWSAGVAGVRASTVVEESPPAATGRLIGALHDVALEVIDPGAEILVFPLLAHWQFTCSGAGDFQSLVQALEVGMLSTLPPDPQPGLGGKPPPRTTRPPPVVLDTGHVQLGHTSREGEAGDVWYRGPLVPRPGGREEPDGQGVLPLFHASDQARRVGPDGRENLSLAAAFEIGRLLALAEPSVVASLLLWRKDGFAQARRSALMADEPTLKEVSDLMAAARAGARAGASLLSRLGKDKAVRLGPVRPPIDPGDPIPALEEGDPVVLLSNGLGVPPSVIRDLVRPGVGRAGGVVVTAAPRATSLERLAARPEGELGGLRDAALGEADRLAREALGLGQEGGPGPVTGPVAGSWTGSRAVRSRRGQGARLPDALDRLLSLEEELP
jgi:hypothetical protein